MVNHPACTGRNKAQTNSNNIEQEQEAIQRYMQEVLKQTEKLETLIQETESLTKALLPLANHYICAYSNFNEYYSIYSDYLDKSREYARQKADELSGITGVRDEILNKTKELSEQQQKDLANPRYALLKKLHESSTTWARNNDVNLNNIGLTSCREQNYFGENSPLSQCMNLGYELWFGIPAGGYKKTVEYAGTLKSTLITNSYAQKKEFLTAWADFTSSLDELYDAQARLYETIYDTYDELSITYGNYSVPLVKDNQGNDVVDNPGISRNEFS